MNMNLVKTMAAGVVVTAALVGSGCSTLNTASNSRFSCEENGDCPTPIEVYSDTHNSPRAVEFGRTPEAWKSGERDAKEREEEKERQAYLRQSLNLAQFDPSSRLETDTGTMAKPIREPSQVMRVWIAPWIDQYDNLNWSGYVYTEVSPRRWGFGEQEVRHFGMPAQVSPQWGTR